MAEKRTERSRDARAAFFLGLALQCIVTEGKAVLGDQSQERHLGDWLHLGFPADDFRYGENEEGERPQRESWALLLALQELVEGQFQRVIRSGTLVADPLPHFRELYRRQLLQASLKKAGQTSGPKDQKKPGTPRTPRARPPDSPEEDALPRLSRKRQRAANEAAMQYHREREEEMLTRLSDMAKANEPTSDREDEDWLALWNPVFALQRQKLMASGLDSERSEAILATWRADRIASSTDLGPLEAVFARLDQDFINWLDYDELRKLTKAECGALRAATRAILAGARRGSHRRDSLSEYLSQTEMRNLRRACEKWDGIRPYLDQLSTHCAGIRASAAAMDRGEEPEEGERLERRRVGRAFLDLAKEAEEAGRSDVAAGLRAVDKRLWGHRLTSRERELEHVGGAWFKGERRESVLRREPDPARVAAAVWRDGSDQAAKSFCQWSLRLALFCWPEGILHSPSSTPPPPE